MAAKKILFDTEARSAVQRGIGLLADAVKVTLGPSGRVVMLSQNYASAPIATKDGVSVARAVELPDRYEDMGARLVREVAERASKLAGDGTTTATVYAEAIFREGLKNVTAGANGNAIKRGIDRAVADLSVELQRLARPASNREQIEKVASCSANHDATIGAVVADAVVRAGKDGVVTVDKGASLETLVESVEGIHFDNGYLSPHFVTEGVSTTLEDAFVFLHEKPLARAADLVPVLEKVAERRKPLLIISEDVTGEALAVLVVNQRRGGLRTCAVKAPGFGDHRRAQLEDLAVATGGRAITEQLHVAPDQIALDDLGRVSKAIVDRDRTTLIEGAGPEERLNDHIDALMHQVSTAGTEHEQQQLRDRLAMPR